MINNTPNVLAVFAHPDDDELTCFGTLVRLSHAGWKVTVLELTNGEKSRTTSSRQRHIESQAAAKLGGFQIYNENLPDGELLYNHEIVSIVENYIALTSASILITHYPQVLGYGHQDHVVVASSVLNAGRRNSNIFWILYSEPPTQNGDFAPNIFVDITNFIEIKRQAINLHFSEKGKSYMHPEVVSTRAKWWAIQAHPDNHVKNRYYEAFVVVKGVLGESI